MPPCSEQISRVGFGAQIERHVIERHVTQLEGQAHLPLFAHVGLVIQLQGQRCRQLVALPLGQQQAAPAVDRQLLCLGQLTGQLLVVAADKPRSQALAEPLVAIGVDRLFQNIGEAADRLRQQRLLLLLAIEGAGAGIEPETPHILGPSDEMTRLFHRVKVAGEGAQV